MTCLLSHDLLIICGASDFVIGAHRVLDRPVILAVRVIDPADESDLEVRVVGPMMP